MSYKKIKNELNTLEKEINRREKEVFLKLNIYKNNNEYVLEKDLYLKDLRNRILDDLSKEQKCIEDVRCLIMHIKECLNVKSCVEQMPLNIDEDCHEDENIKICNKLIKNSIDTLQNCMKYILELEEQILQNEIKRRSTISKISWKLDAELEKDNK